MLFLDILDMTEEEFYKIIKTTAVFRKEKFTVYNDTDVSDMVIFDMMRINTEGVRMPGTIIMELYCSIVRNETLLLSCGEIVK